jgi:hypothetical protein
MQRTARALLALAALTSAATVPTAASAQLRSGFTTTLVPRGDDNQTAPVSIGFNLFVRGETYSSANLCMNGYLWVTGVIDDTACRFNNAGGGNTLRDAFGTAFSGLFRDLNSTNAASGQLGYGSGTVGGRNAWGVTWNGVWTFGGTTSASANFFQLIFVDRSDRAAGDFDLEYNYGALDTGFGTLFAGAVDDGGFSGTAYTAAVTPAQNSRTLQCWVGGSVAATCPTTPGPVVPEPSTYALFATGLIGLAGIARRRSSRA